MKTLTLLLVVLLASCGPSKQEPQTIEEVIHESFQPLHDSIASLNREIEKTKATADSVLKQMK